MTPFELTAVFLTLVAVGGWLNARTVKLPHAVAMLLVGLTGALSVFVLDWLRLDFAADAVRSIEQIDFARTVLGYMLAFLLFAGAMQVDLTELKRRALTVLTLATVGVAASTVIVGGGVWLIARLLGLELPLAWALVFGALISPTDPIAVLAAVKHGNLSRALQVILQGEALFNDGVGIVVFTALVAFASGLSPSPVDAVLHVVVEAVGGLALGLAAGFVVLKAARAIDDFVVEVGMTIALAMAVYAGAQALHLSGPIAVVAAGLLVGDCDAGDTMSDTTHAYLKSFWTLVDEILNALLFVLLGLQLLVVPWKPQLAGLCVAATALVVASRFIVILPWGSYLGRRHEERGANLILAWGGLHGALSLALALSLPPGPYKPLILAATFVTAAFSVAVQGLSFGAVTSALRRRATARSSQAG